MTALSLREEPVWEQKHWGPSPELVYTRPLLGSELLVDQLTNFFNSLTEVSHGLTFTNKLSSAGLEHRMKTAMIRLRYFPRRKHNLNLMHFGYTCPIVGATIEVEIHDPQLRSSVYRPIKDEADLQSWLRDAAITLQEPVNPDTFILRMTQQRIPYICPDSTMQVLRSYLSKPTETPRLYAIFFHGNPEPDVFADIKWGTEWNNLPVGPIAATGGPRPGWETDGVALLGNVGKIHMTPNPCTLQYSRDVPIIAGKPFRLRATLSEADATQIMKKIKASGFSPTHLLGAASSLAVFATLGISNENATPETHIILPSTIISIAKDFISSINIRSHFVSYMALVPLQMYWDKVAGGEDEKSRLLAAMTHYKAQYDNYLANTHLPHFTAELMRMAPPREPPPGVNPAAVTPTNIGVVEHTVPLTRRAKDRDGEPVLQIDEMFFGHRLPTLNIMVHMWSMKSKLILQIQASDCWDQEYLQGFLDEVVRQMKLLSQ
ncbi:hypothetical protein CERSUDRAFT_96470 [Gelatoporia subvermispora B]|uniref:Condensation domain-containing protein n=1 Tax=Ceriporiopsis subvermispora (strain B) TaxID=914234 RepID=M2R9C2_CERS8|nr:hypothetical protein CERSUDRAFT_96470 [Gelatoporia subvermispora B]